LKRIFNMKTTSTHLGITQLEWQTYEVIVGTTPTSLAPAALTVDTFESPRPGELIFSLNSGETKKWLRAGQVIRASGWTGDPINLSLNRMHRIKSVDYALDQVLVEAPWITDSTPYSGSDPGEISLVVHAQRALIQVPTGGATITVSPSAQALSVPYGYRQTIAAAAEKEFVAPHGAKFDMADWVATVGASTQAVRILVI
jgi:hypothetical protein